MLDVIEGVAAELRRMNVPVSTSELIDAARSLRTVPLADREAVRAAVGACLAKSVPHQDAYGIVFDLFWPRNDAAGPRLADGESLFEQLPDDELRRILLQSLAKGGTSAMREVARVIVDRNAGMQPGRAVAGTFYIFRALRSVQADTLADDVVALDPPAEGPTRSLSLRLARERAGRAVVGFERMVETEVRRRLVEDRGAEAVAATLRSPLPADADFLTASTPVIEHMRRVVDPLGRALGHALTAKRRRRGRGHLDFRATIRDSLSTGGVPVRLHLRKPRPSKPKLVVIADISGSVATFAQFTLQLTSALQTRFSSLRSFVFIDGMDEVTDLLTAGPTIRDASARINNERRGFWFDGRSDYGHALQLFQEKYADAVDSRTTVLLLGDARGNYHEPHAEVLAGLHGRAARVFWLNPERRVSWNEGDSVVAEYAKHCDAVYECRNINDLKNFVESLA